MRIVRSLGIVCVVCGLATVGVAQRPQSGAAKLCVDIVSVKNGPRLRGAIIGRDKKGTVTIAVRQSWLQARYPELAAKHAAEETADSDSALTELLQRIKAWRIRRPDEARLQFFLEQQQELFEQQMEESQQPAEDDIPRFVNIRIPARQTTRVYAQPKERRQIAQLAWREKYDDVETASADDLAKRLKEQGIDIAGAAGGSSDELGPVRRQSEKEWAARVAICEYQYVGSVDFQGTGNFIVRTDGEAAAPDMAPLVSGLFQQGLTAELGDLLGEPIAGKPQQQTWMQTATKAAEEADRNGVRVTRIDQNLLAGRATVEVRFLARMPNGSWETVWMQRVTADTSKRRPELEKRIRSDPRVAQVLDTFQGLLGGGDDQANLALRFGAATMEAQQLADGKFFEFRDRYLRQLDRPPIVW